MENRKITRKIMKDRKYPGPEQIRKFQDFDRLVKDHSLIKKVMMKKLLIWGGSVIGLSGLIALVVMNLNTKETQKSVDDARPVNEPVAVAAINPPIPGKEQPYTIYHVSAKDGGEIHHPTGSSLIIPAHAFRKQNGEEPKDSVTIKYREFHDVLDLFLSGIPMQYDSAGLKRTFESAGMIEVLAYEGEEALKLNEQTPIKVNLVSHTDDEKYRLYELDQALNNWLDIGKDEVKKPEPVKVEKRATVRTPEKLAEEVKEEQLLKPEKADPTKCVFPIKPDLQQFPELAAYQGVLFEVTDNNFDCRLVNVRWESIKVMDGKLPGHYVIKVRKVDSIVPINARVVFAEKDYEAALRKFEEKHQAATKLREEKDKEKQKAIDRTDKELSEYNRGQMLHTMNKMLGLTNQRTFSIRQLGTFNCDFPLPPVVNFAITVIKASEAEKRSGGLNYNTIYMAEKGKNALFRFEKGEAVKCDPKAKNLMWTVTEKKEIAFFRVSDYTKLQNGNSYDLKPEVAKSQEAAFEEIRTFSSVK